MDERRRALIIATDRYEDAALNALRSPSVDADSLGTVLGDPSIGAFETTRLLNEHHYTVRQAIEDFADASLPSDLLLLYISGHGVKDEGGNLFLATSDTRRDRPRSTAVEAGFVDAVLRHARARRQVLILDCCFSGAFPVGMAAKSDGTVTLSEHLNSRGRVVLASSNAIQYSFEGSELIASDPVGSIFTQILVAGLETGEADLNGDGQIDVDELYEFIYDRMTEVTPHQTPQKTAERIEGEILIARNPFLQSASAAAGVRAREARAELLHLQLAEALTARISSLPESRHAAVLAMRRISESAAEVDPAMATEIAAALGPMTLDPHPEVAQAAQAALEYLVSDTGVGPSGKDPVPPAQTVDLRRRRLGWVAAGLAGLAAAVIAMVLVLGNGETPEIAGVTVTSTAFPTTAPTSLPDLSINETVEVPPDGSWQETSGFIDTGVGLAVGDMVEIEATGEASHNGEIFSGPEGDPNPEVRQFNLEELTTVNHNALVGRIGLDSTPFLIGERTSFTAETPGTLYLGVNDAGVPNNTGSYLASITVTRSGAS